MSDDRFTAIIVGAGPAGSTAAYLLAKEGYEVLLIEKGSAPGAKNMFGGRMYAHALNRIIPGFWEEAPVERPVVREIITFMDGGRSTSVTCRDQGWAEPPYHSFTLLRAEFDAWLAAKAEDAGAMLACNICVDDPLYENGKVVGIRAGEDEMFADVVIAADGVNSILAQKAGLAAMFSAGQVATGAKQIIELPAEEIGHRFGLEGEGGAAQLFVGDCTRRIHGGGFLYTNKRSISLGLVLNTASLGKGQIRVVDLIEDFKANPEIAPLIDGGTVAEYSAHLIPEAGLGMTPQLFSDGMLVAGDAAGFVLNLGYIVRGMDFAIASGEAAAGAVKAARQSGDFSKAGLAVYRKLLSESFVLRDLEAYRRAPEFTANPRLYGAYPEFVTSLASRLFTVDGSQPVHVLGKVWDHFRKSGLGLTDIAGDGWKGVKWL
ncbi:MAG: FAD-dependent oxidoreductase [Desulfobacteraceae bacterium]|nr:FAD-dependent oxidoreductase [Desulfobacteraceae bacterium]